MKARLVRYVHVLFEALDEREASMTCDYDGVTISIVARSNWNDGRSVLAIEASTAVTTELNAPRSGRLPIPHDDRRRCERVIEQYANAVTVLSGKSHEIRSPLACIALAPIDDEAAAAFAQLDGLQPESLKRAIGVQLGVPELHPRHFDMLVDRWDGAALLAEALGNSHPTGRFRELMRIFEHAFKKAGLALTGPLSAFLASGGHHEASQVRDWINLRDMATHADLKHQRRYATQADVHLVLRDVEVAAYDVLFNKARWHEPSSGRRIGLPPGFLKTGPNEFRMDQSTARRNLNVVVFDLAGSYPCDLSAGWTAPNPDWIWLDGSAIRALGTD